MNTITIQDRTEILLTRYTVYSHLRTPKCLYIVLVNVLVYSEKKLNKTAAGSYLSK